MGREDRQESEEPEPALDFDEDELDGGFDVDDDVDADTDGPGREVDPGFFGDDLEAEGDGLEGALPDEADEEATGPSDESVARTSLGTVLESLTLRAQALWATVLAQARGVELPGAPEGNLKRYGTVAAIVLVSLFVGTGTFLLARGSGEDVGQAMLEGEAAGRQAGAIEGAAQGYPAGFRKGRRKGFRKTYVPAYRLYYKRAFEQAGLDAPTNKQFVVPLP